MWAKNTIIDVQNTLQYLLQNISLQTVQNLSTEIDLFAISRVRGSVNNFIIMNKLLSFACLYNVDTFALWGVWSLMINFVCLAECTACANNHSFLQNYIAHKYESMISHPKNHIFALWTFPSNFANCAFHPFDTGLAGYVLHVLISLFRRIRIVYNTRQFGWSLDPICSLNFPPNFANCVSRHNLLTHR